MAELHRLGRVLSRQRAEILAYHDTRRSNGPIEAVNLLIEKTRRIGHGFANYHNYRLRLLLRCALHLAYSPRRTKCEAPRFIA